MSLTGYPIRFIYVPSECVHRTPWATPCVDCDLLAVALAERGPSAIPKNVMALATVVAAAAAGPQPQELEAGPKLISDGTKTQAVGSKIVGFANGVKWSTPKL